MTDIRKRLDGFIYTKARQALIPTQEWGWSKHERQPRSHSE